MPADHGALDFFFFFFFFFFASCSSHLMVRIYALQPIAN
jgi:hypothetical protein